MLNVRPEAARAMKRVYQPSSFNIRHYEAVSFSGCGALNFYQTGVGYGLQTSGLTHRLHFLGASAGGGLAFTMAAGLDARMVCATMASWIVSYGSGRLLRPSWAYEVAQRFTRHFVSPSTYASAKGRFSLSITQLSPLKNLRVGRFEGLDDLRAGLIASCFLPYPGKLHVEFRGRKVVDGGFTDNQPTRGTSTLRVSPFWPDRRAKIRPPTAVHPSQALVVPTEAECWSLFNQGLLDCETWMGSKQHSLSWPLLSRREARAA